MKIFRNRIEGRPLRYAVAALGNFDGVHRGHRVILARAIAQARRRNGESLVVTFDPHPASVVAPHLDFKLLTLFDEKLAIFKEIGVDKVLCLDFTPEFAAQSPEEFVRRILAEEVRCREVFVGENFAFGKGRSGRVQDLVRLGDQYGFAAHVVGTVLRRGNPVSSSRVRAALLTGDVGAAADMLGRSYALSGTVKAGSGRGAELGFPTANLLPPESLVVPCDGIYATWGVIAGRRYPGVSYIGSRPTFGPGQRYLELHLLDQSRRLYGRQLSVEFVKFIRPDQTFTDSKALSRQIGDDVKQARRLLRRAPNAGRPAMGRARKKRKK